MISRTIYQLFIHLGLVLVQFIAIFNRQARDWLSVRRHRTKILLDPGSPVVWFHVASLGEFEQGRPLIEAMKQENPGIQIVLTFFSSSGFKMRKDYEHAAIVEYLPVDTRKKAAEFIMEIRPDLVILVKYDFWYNHLWTLREKGVPVILISAAFRKSQYLFGIWGGTFRKTLQNFDQIFVQDKSSHHLLVKSGFINTQQSGDTRVDRVIRIAQEAGESGLIKEFGDRADTVIAGSTWPTDESVLFQAIHEFPNLQWIIAPHKPEDEHIRDLMIHFGKQGSRFSELKDVPEGNVIILDVVGLLAYTYRYARMAFIGGGFGSGIHNILEPAAYGIPVIFGPKYQKFTEAIDLIQLGGAFSVGSASDMIATLEYLSGSNAYDHSSRAVRSYIERSQGATQKILDYIRTRFPQILDDL